MICGAICLLVRVMDVLDGYSMRICQQFGGQDTVEVEVDRIGDRC